jgi:pyruvate/2-oxoglutarate dehydrogenase complex dihydrolipoamide acyltransferase (E2) component
MNRIGNYQMMPFSKNRRNIVLILNEGWRRHSTNWAIDIDVNKAIKSIKNQKDKGKDISFTGFIIKCVGQALSEHKELNALRHGKRKLVIFDDVDVAIPVERLVSGEMQPMVYIVRKVNEKTILEITKEIRNAQSQSIKNSTQLLGENVSKFEKFALKSPIFLKKFLLFLSRRNAILKKKYMGTVGVTSIGMKGRFPGWVIPMGGTTTFLFVIGNILKKPVAVNDKVEIRNHLNLTISVDHDIADGGPLARFLDRFIELIEIGYGLNPD